MSRLLDRVLQNAVVLEQIHDGTERQQLDVEDQCGMRGNLCTRARVAVGVLRGDREFRALSTTHSCDRQVPTFDHLTHSDLELERLVAVTRRIELGPVGQQCPDIVDGNIVASRREIRLRYGGSYDNFLDDLGREFRRYRKPMDLIFHHIIVAVFVPTAAGSGVAMRHFQ